MKKCPECGNNTLFTMYGCGWDCDRLICMDRNCDYEQELDTITYVDMVTGEIEEVIQIDED